MKWMILLLHERKEVWEEKEALEQTRHMLERNMFYSEGLAIEKSCFGTHIVFKGSRGQCGKS